MLNIRFLRNVLLISAIGFAAGCGGRAAVLPEEGRTMLEIYQSHIGSAGNEAQSAARSALRGSGNDENDENDENDDDVDSQSYTRTAQNEIEVLFVRLPNPDLILYVFPHLATEEAIPIPGYSTVFPLYERVVYALPGEAP